MEFITTDAHEWTLMKEKARNLRGFRRNGTETYCGLVSAFELGLVFMDAGLEIGDLAVNLGQARKFIVFVGMVLNSETTIGEKLDAALQVGDALLGWDEFGFGAKFFGDFLAHDVEFFVGGF